ncbi:WD repeat-containing protein jip5 [Savitreella phatthalungensis]
MTILKTASSIFAGLPREHDIQAVVHHPSRPELAISCVTGHVYCVSYTPDEVLSRNVRERKPVKEQSTAVDKLVAHQSLKVLWATRRHKQSCRAIAYSPNGQWLVTAGADRVVKRCDGSTGKVVQKFEPSSASAGEKGGTETKKRSTMANAMHGASINAACWVNEDVFVTADDDGHLRGWSIKQNAGPIRAYQNAHNDYISQLVGLESRLVLAISGDGTLTVHDLRVPQDLSEIFSQGEVQADQDHEAVDDPGKRKRAKESKGAASKKRKTRSPLVKRSDDQEDELLCIAGPFKHGSGQFNLDSDMDSSDENDAAENASKTDADFAISTVSSRKLSKKDKFLVGTSEGVVAIFSAGDWGDCTDRILAPPSLLPTDETVPGGAGRGEHSSNSGQLTKRQRKRLTEEVISPEVIVQLDGDRALVGGSDGRVRLLHVLPNRWLGVAADTLKDNRDDRAARQAARDELFAQGGLDEDNDDDFDSELDEDDEDEDQGIAGEPVTAMAAVWTGALSEKERNRESSPLIFVATGYLLRVYTVPDKLLAIDPNAPISTEDEHDRLDSDDDNDEDDQNDDDDSDDDDDDHDRNSVVQDEESEDAIDEAGVAHDEDAAESAVKEISAELDTNDGELDEASVDGDDSDCDADNKLNRNQRKREKRRQLEKQRKDAKRAELMRAAGKSRSTFFDDL